MQSPKIETYYPYAGELIAYIHHYAPQAEIIIHETWSHSIDSYRNLEWGIHPDDMYADLHAAYAQIAREFGLRVVPVGTAFQNARATPMWDYQPTTIDVKTLRYPQDKDNLPDQSRSLNSNFFWRKNDDNIWTLRNDGFHANANGEYLGGLVWYAFFFGADPRHINYSPPTLTEAQAASLRTIAYKTVQGPLASPLKPHE